MKNDGTPEASWKQNLGLICSFLSALGAVPPLSLYFGFRPWNSGGHILWLVLAVALFALSIGISLYVLRRFRETISLLEESKRELEGQLAERDSRIAELENELGGSDEVKISPY